MTTLDPKKVLAERLDPYMLRHMTKGRWYLLLAKESLGDFYGRRRIRLIKCIWYCIRSFFSKQF